MDGNKMNDNKQIKTEDKLQWKTPKLIDLDSNADNIENGFDAGNDGAGGLTTSMS